jgi:hypothetical protein
MFTIGISQKETKRGSEVEVGLHVCGCNHPFFLLKLVPKVKSIKSTNLQFQKGKRIRDGAKDVDCCGSG